MFYIDKVRLGFATNSSSTHSIIVLPSARSEEPNMGLGSFGWDNFVLKREDSKKHYLALILARSLNYRNEDAEWRKGLVRAVIEDDLGHISDLDLDSDYIEELSCLWRWL